jgi:hypothetical protein
MPISRRAVLGGVAVAVAVPDVALAAKPVPGAHYSQQRNDRLIVNFDVSKDGSTVKNFSQYGKCNPVPFAKPINMPIRSRGRFSLDARRMSVLKKRFHIVVSGRFITSKRATGTYRVTGQGCTQKAIAFDAKFAPPVG